MKKFTFASLLLLSVGVSAQDTYLNEQMTNNSSDVIGTARFVGMGGAMGALGADMGVIGWNPAGIGLFRKSDVSISFGGLFNKSRIDDENRGAASFDQAGAVFNFKTYNPTCPYLNFAVNYQKKLDFNRNFYADNHAMNGLSQMDIFAELASDGFDTKYNSAGGAVYYDLLTPLDENGVPTTDKAKIVRYRNMYRGSYSRYTHHTEGGLHAFELNFSTNVKERAYVGMTIGLDNMNYRGYTNYYEENKSNFGYYGDYSLYDDYKITGYGVNVKLGAIVRPVEDNPLRIGLALETPTWYRFKSSQVYDFTTYNVPNPSALPDDPEEVKNKRQEWRSASAESYLEYTVRTPWKIRASVGSTVGNYLAWDVDYELTNYSQSKMGYPKYDDWDGGSSFSNTTDKAMNQLTKNTLKAQHTLRAGVEYRPVEPLSLRLGYNFTTSAYKDNVGFDQYSLNSAAMDYSVNTSYMTASPTNILTLGVGYKFKHFYVDMAYKIRSQKADFYAFDSSFAKAGSQFSKDNVNLEGASLRPTEVDLTRQSITCTLGVKF